MIKRAIAGLLLGTLMSAGSNAVSGLDLAALVKKSPPCLWVITTHPVSPYYGAGYADDLVNYAGCERVLVTYIKADATRSNSAIKHKMETILREAVGLSPKAFLMFDANLWRYVAGIVPPARLKELESKTFLLRSPFAPIETTSLLKIIRSSFILPEILKGFQLDGLPVYIMRDKSRESRDFSDKIKARLTGKHKVKMIEVGSIQEMRSKVQGLNMEPKGILINSMFVLEDRDAHRTRYTDFITDIMVRSNITHVDIGFFRSLYNESIVIDLDLVALAQVLAQSTNFNADEITDQVEVGVDVYINPHRLRKFEVPYVNAFEMIDGVLDR